MSPSDVKAWLTESIRTSDLNALAGYLSGKGDPNIFVAEGVRLVDLAIEAENGDAVEMLRKAGAIIPGQTEASSHAVERVPLEERMKRWITSCIQEGDNVALAGYLSMQQDPNAYIADGKHLIDIAIESRNIEAVRLLAEAKAEFRQTNTLKKWLTSAVETGDNVVLGVYLAAQNDPNMYVAQDTRLLHVAVASRNVQAVRMLLDSDAAFTAKEHTGQCVFDSAVSEAKRKTLPVEPRNLAVEREKQTAIITMMKDEAIRRNMLDEMLFLVASHGMEKGTRDMLKAGASIRHLDPDGNSALHFAALSGNPKAAALLLDAGCDPNTANHNGIKPIHRGAQSLRAPMVELLIQRGANVRVSDEDGFTTPHYGAHSAAVLKVLLHHGARVDERSYRRRAEITEQNRVTPLFLASQSKDPDAAALLLDNGANPNPSRFDVMRTPTPLINAAKAGNDGAARALVKHGAKLDDADKSGTPLMHAAHLGHHQVCSTLILAGADTTMVYREYQGENRIVSKLTLGHAARDTDTRNAIAAAKQQRKNEHRVSAAFDAITRKPRAWVHRTFDPKDM